MCLFVFNYLTTKINAYRTRHCYVMLFEIGPIAYSKLIWEHGIMGWITAENIQSIVSLVWNLDL